MMTLAEMTDFVCDKLGRSNEESTDICKAFLNARYKMLWDSEGWVDTHGVVTVSSTAGLPHVLMPLRVQRVIQVRDSTNDRILGNIQAGAFLQMAPSEFDTAGDTVSFAQASAAVGYVTASAEVAFGAAAVGVEFSVTTELVSTGAITTNDFTTQAAGADDEPESGDVIISSPSWILAFTKEESESQIVIREAIGDATIVGLNASDKAAVPRARIRLLQPNVEALSLLCMVKHVCPGLPEDHSISRIRNSDNALISFALGDMLERDRQYAKAQLKFQEAAAQIAIMRDLEKNQQANICRIIPEDYHDSRDGYGFSGKGYW